MQMFTMLRASETVVTNLSSDFTEFARICGWKIMTNPSMAVYYGTDTS